jgi:hypothetical protein
MTVAFDFVAALVGPTARPTPRQNRNAPRSANPGRDPPKIRGDLSKQPEPALISRKRTNQLSFLPFQNLFGCPGAKTMATKLSVKIGKIEFEYEGETNFTQEDIKDLFSHLEALKPAQVAVELPSDGENLQRSRSNGTVRPLSTSTIASRLGGKGASNVALAAAAHLQLVDGKETFTRQELNADMRAASQHYNENMAKNLSQTLKTMVTQKFLNEVKVGVYSLTAAKQTELEALLAGQG